MSLFVVFIIYKLTLRDILGKYCRFSWFRRVLSHNELARVCCNLFFPDN